ncbi:MAG TPA: DUF2785 domain-containing protein [Hyphomonas sp.]|nr:DUF2785 domain-containing protein [Hyphomonas sp.]
MQKPVIRTVAAAAILVASACASQPAQATPPPVPEVFIPAPVANCLVIPDMVEPGPARDAAYFAMDAATRTRLLLSLPGCLDLPDPALRDTYAFEVLSLILRGGDQSPDTVRMLMHSLMDRIGAADRDVHGFRNPFMFLALAEVARVDRLTPFLSEEERWDLLMAAKAYFAGLEDYRGFTEGEGWRHGVAHTADLLMQMSLNAHLTKPQAEEILAAIASKVAPENHVYIFGESERLAAPVIYLAWKETFTAEEWEAWFSALWPADDPLRETAYKSEATLAKLHNLRAFAQSVYVSAVASNDDRMKPLAGAAFQFLNQLP